MRRHYILKKMSLEEQYLSLDSHETFFFENEIEEDFYEDNQSKDLFKKFELLPTPPHSPKHEPFPPDIQASVDKRLQLVSQVLDENDPMCRTIFPSACDEWSYNLSSKLIQDCMWSAPGLAAAGLLSPSDLKKLGTPVPPSPTSPCPSDDGKAKKSSQGDINSTQCVDPAAVFPYPISDPHKRTFAVKTPVGSLGSFAETPSPSESEDEEEEIDVVTVDKSRRQTTTKVIPVHHKPMTLTAHVAAMHNYSNAPCSAPNSAPHSPTHSPSHGHKRSRPCSMPASPQPPCKRQKSLLHTPDLKKVVQKLKLSNPGPNLHHYSSSSSTPTSSQNSSDSEDCDGNKRAQHNVLERKRRNDLKYSFLRVKEHVPELSKQDRAAKVVILRKAGDHIRQLQMRNTQLLREEEKQRRLHQQLQHRINQLRQECF